MRLPDLIVVVLYLAVVVGVGLRFRGRSATVDEYFTARGLFRGRLGTFVLGLSIAASLFSGISLIAYVSSAYASGAQIVIGLVALPIAWAVLTYWFLPRYLAGGEKHPYGIIERRFGRKLRRLLSAMFILIRLGWIGVLINAPALVIMGIFGLSAEWRWPVVAAIGLGATVYTYFGGIRGIIVMDAVQFVIIAVGLFGIAASILFKLHSPVGAIVGELAQSGRLEVFDFSLDLRKPFTFWSVVLGIGVSNLGSYLSDQMALQRYLASESAGAAARSFLINIVSAILVVTTLVVIGLLLSVWYLHHPPTDLPEKPDQILSYFIARELPVGMAGLLIAAIMAATLNSMTSGINSMAGALTNDWVAVAAHHRTPAELYRFGRRASLGIGLAATAIAEFVSMLGPILQASQIVMDGFTGAMLACMVLAVSDRRMDGRAMMTGVLAGVASGWVVTLSPLSKMWLSPISFTVAIAVALLCRRKTGGLPMRGN